MVKDFWINLPVKNIKTAVDFFTHLGFKLNSRYGNTENSASLVIGDQKVIMMLFDEPTFTGFVNSDISDSIRYSEILLSVDAQSKEEVDDMARKAVEAGGKSSHIPAEMVGWMYGCLFSDPDGHRWNVLYMDMTKMPKR